MRKNLIYVFAFLCCIGNTVISYAQNIGINTTGATPDSTAMLDIASSNKGLLIPRMDSTSRKNIVTPAKGLMVFDSTYNSFYFHDGTNWTAIGGGSDNLGDHIATQNVQLKDNWLNNNGVDNKGIQIDTNGYVGVNRIPEGSFQVSTGLAASATQISQPNIAGATFELTQVPAWQSFTAPPDYFVLTQFVISPFSAPAPTYNYTLYAGEGIGGTVLASGSSSDDNYFPFNDILLEPNQKYTVSITKDPFFSSNIILHSGSGDSYAGGMSSLSGNDDITFWVNGKGLNSEFLVDATGVSFENYAFPNADGTADQVLATDGSGTLSWSPIPFSDYTLPGGFGSANQVLSTDGSGTLSWSLNPFSNYTLPGGFGSANQVLSTDGSGVLSWSTNNTSVLEDADQNTKIQVEKNANEDIIRFDLNGTEKWVMEGNTFANRDTNLLIGNNVGLNVTTGERLTTLGNYALSANTSGSDNIAIGNNTLLSNTTGYNNIAIGNSALDALTTGDGNVAIGHDALGVSTSSLNTAVGVSAGQGVTSGFGNTFLGHWAGYTVNLGSYNVMIGQYAGLNRNMSEATLVGHGAGVSSFGTRATAIGRSAGANSGHGGIYLGYGAGQNEYGADKLYIDNTSTSTPLIWGDLANDSIKIHGTFNINDAYSFPLVDGANGQVLQTDGAGQLTWVGIGGNQNLSINANDSLVISNGNAVSLVPYKNDVLSIANDSLSISGGNKVDLSPYFGLGNHTATQNLIIAGNAIQNNSSSTNGLTMGAENQLLVESGSNRSGHFTTTGVNNLGDPFGSYLEVNNHSGTRSIFGADGSGLYSTDTLNTVLGNWTTDGGITFHVSGGVKEMTLDASGNLGIGRIPATNRLEVNGDASKTTAGNWLANSDARLKKNITSLSSNDMLNKLLSLNGVTYEWNDTQTETKRPEGIQFGFTAQNIQDVFPSLVTEDNNGFLQTPYGTYDAMTVEAIRALNDKIEELQIENAQLKSQVSEVANLKSEMAELKAMITQITDVKSTPGVNAKK